MLSRRSSPKHNLGIAFNLSFETNLDYKEESDQKMDDGLKEVAAAEGVLAGPRFVEHNTGV